MALHTGDSQQTQAQAPQQATAPQQQQSFQQPRQQNNNRFNTLPSFGLTNQLGSFGSGGESYEKLYKKLQEAVKKTEEAKTEEKFGVVKLLKQQAGLNYSGIVLTETKDGTTAAHVLMIEKTGTYPDKLVDNVNGVRYEIMRTPADALDEKYVTQTVNAVSKQLGVEASSVVVVDGTLVPNEFDVESESQVASLVNNAFNAVCAEVATRVLDYKGFDLQSLIQNYRNGKFYVQLYFNGDDVVYLDQTGLPVRQDVCVVLSYKNNTGNNNKSVNQGDDTVELVKTYGYFDFEFTNSQIVNGMMQTQKFVPNFVITHIETNGAPTPDLYMLGVVSVYSLSDNMNWIQAFRPSVSRKNEIDYNDIGALNIEGNIEQNPIGYGKKYDTKSKTFSMVEMNRLITTLVRSDMMISIDCPKAGPETWFTSVFYHIKFRNSKDAYDRVNDYLTHMTNGAYQHNNIAMFADVTNKIHGGFYKSKDGFKDVRHLTNYLAVANYINDTNQQPNLISGYTNTLYDMTTPSEIRATYRKKLLDDMSNNTSVVKQFYDRLAFNGSFLNNLVMALKSVGFAPVFNNMAGTNDMFVRRSTADFNSALIGNNVRLMTSNNVYSGVGNFSYYNRTY